jgi:hypothetical protein
MNGIEKRSPFGLGPQELRLTAAGLVLGLVVGLYVGSVGIAAKGTAHGVPAALVLGALFALIGNRIGVAFDRPRA